jgi:hypothetical protein
MASRRTPDIPKPVEPVRSEIPSAVPPTLRPARVPKSPLTSTARQVTPEERRRLIAENAYLRAERRGFTAGHETEDWLAAEAEVDALLKVGASSPQ